MSLIAHYPLQEDAGSTVYDVRGGNNGTNNGATVGANGILGASAYDFGGTNDNIDLGTSIPRFQDSPFTVSAWVNKDTADASEEVLNHDSDRVILGYEPPDGSGNGWEFVVFDGNFQAVSSGNTTIGEWVFLVGVYDGSKIELYIGDSSALQSAGTTNVSTPHTDIFSTAIGSASQDTGRYFNGRIADVRFYDHALTQSEISYLNSVVRGENELVSDWKVL